MMTRPSSCSVGIMGHKRARRHRGTRYPQLFNYLKWASGIAAIISRPVCDNHSKRGLPPKPLSGRICRSNRPVTHVIKLILPVCGDLIFRGKRGFCPSGSTPTRPRAGCETPPCSLKILLRFRQFCVPRPSFGRPASAPDRYWCRYCFNLVVWRRRDRAGRSKGRICGHSPRGGRIGNRPPPSFMPA